MKKNLKTTISLLIAVLMLAGIAPGVFAAVDVSRLPTANTNGRLIEAGMTIKVGDADNMSVATDGAWLADGFHFAAAEIYKHTAANLSTITESGVALTDSKNNPVTTGFKTLDATNDTIEFEWTEAKMVKRLEMWIYPVGAIKDYEITYLDGDEWKNCCDGSFDQNQPVPQNGKNAVAYIITFDEVTTTKLRFRATRFREGYTSAKIAEAVPRNVNNINLLAGNSLSSTWNGSTSEMTYSSPYALNYAVSGTNRSQYEGGLYNGGGKPNAMPANSTWSGDAEISANSSGQIWYAVRLTDSPQRVNKVALTVEGAAIKKFEVYCNTGTEIGLGSGKTAPTGNWQLVATAKGNFAKGTRPEVYIPETVAAEYWMIKVTEFESGAKIKYPGLYVLADSEIPSSLTDAKLSGDVKAGETVDFSIYSCNIEEPKATLYFGLFSGETLVDAAVKPFALTGIGKRTESYTIPSNSGDNLKLRAFIWNSETLVPILQQPAMAPAAE